MRYDLEGEVATPPPGWWVCPVCGRRRDRDGDRATWRSCSGLGWAAHAPRAMRVESDRPRALGR